MGPTGREGHMVWSWKIFSGINVTCYFKVNPLEIKWIHLSNCMISCYLWPYNSSAQMDHPADLQHQATWTKHAKSMFQKYGIPINAWRDLWFSIRHVSFGHMPCMWRRFYVGHLFDKLGLLTFTQLYAWWKWYLMYTPPFPLTVIFSKNLVFSRES